MTTIEAAKSLSECVSRLEFVIETVSNGTDLDGTSTARFGMGLILRDLEERLSGIRNAIGTM